MILKAAVDTAAESKAVKSAEFERIAVDTARQEKAQRHSAIKRAAKLMPVGSSVWRARSNASARSSANGSVDGANHKGLKAFLRTRRERRRRGAPLGHKQLVISRKQRLVHLAPLHVRSQCVETKEALAAI